MGVDDEPCDFVVFVRDQQFFEESRQWNFGEGHLREGALFFVLRRNSGERVSRSRGRCLGQQRLQIAEGAGVAGDGD